MEESENLARALHRVELTEYEASLTKTAAAEAASCRLAMQLQEEEDGSRSKRAPKKTRHHVKSVGVQTTVNSHLENEIVVQDLQQQLDAAWDRSGELTKTMAGQRAEWEDRLHRERAGFANASHKQKKEIIRWRRKVNGLGKRCSQMLCGVLPKSESPAMVADADSGGGGSFERPPLQRQLGKPRQLCANTTIKATRPLNYKFAMEESENLARALHRVELAEYEASLTKTAAAEAASCRLAMQLQEEEDGSRSKRAPKKTQHHVKSVGVQTTVNSHLENEILVRDLQQQLDAAWDRSGELTKTMAGQRAEWEDRLHRERAGFANASHKQKKEIIRWRRKVNGLGRRCRQMEREMKEREDAIQSQAILNMRAEESVLEVSAMTDSSSAMTSSFSSLGTSILEATSNASDIGVTSNHVVDSAADECSEGESSSGSDKIRAHAERLLRKLDERLEEVNDQQRRGQPSVPQITDQSPHHPTCHVCKCKIEDLQFDIEGIRAEAANWKEKHEQAERLNQELAVKVIDLANENKLICANHAEKIANLANENERGHPSASAYYESRIQQLKTDNKRIKTEATDWKGKHERIEKIDEELFEKVIDLADTNFKLERKLASIQVSMHRGSAEEEGVVAFAIKSKHSKQDKSGIQASNVESAPATMPVNEMESNESLAMIQDLDAENYGLHQSMQQLKSDKEKMTTEAKDLQEKLEWVEKLNSELANEIFDLADEDQSIRLALGSSKASLEVHVTNIEDEGAAFAATEPGKPKSNKLCVTPANQVLVSVEEDSAASMMERSLNKSITTINGLVANNNKFDKKPEENVTVLALRNQQNDEDELASCKATLVVSSTRDSMAKWKEALSVATDSSRSELNNLDVAFTSQVLATIEEESAGAAIEMGLDEAITAIADLEEENDELHQLIEEAMHFTNGMKEKMASFKRAHELCIKGYEENIVRLKEGFLVTLPNEELSVALAALKEENEVLRAALEESNNVEEYHDHLMELDAEEGGASPCLRKDVEDAIREREEANRECEVLQWEIDLLRQSLDYSEVERYGDYSHSSRGEG